MSTAPAPASPVPPTRSAALSVILVTPDDYETIRKTVCHLRKQKAADRMELLIVAPGRESLGMDEEELGVFAAWDVIEVGVIRTLASVKALAIRQARAPVIVQAEDHSYPGPNWAEALIATHGQGYAVVGPAVKNANPATFLSWANYLMHFGAWADGIVGVGEVEQVAWHNCSYRRDLLLAYGDDLPRLLAVESALQENIRRNGHRIFLAADVVTSHVNISDPRTAFSHHFCGGRLFAATRAHEGGWPPWKRLIYFCGAPLIPLVRFPRLLGHIARYKQRKQLLPGILFPMAVALFCHAAGEAIGYAFGIGNAEEQYSRFEMRRIDHLCARDRESGRAR
ncbi:MAG: hypothetical protein H7145_11370 [Akkermansiaceae bacterium]|nr:hypothetical protein [Armatimonadota bacterium]